MSIEESDSEAHVEIHRPDMGILPVRQGPLLHQQRRDHVSNHDKLIHLDQIYGHDRTVK